MSVKPVTIGRATHIYALCDEGGIVRYVGKTVRTPMQRFCQHKTNAKRSELPVCRWLRKHPGATVRLLETVAAEEDWAAREAHWIASYDNLLNLTEGGEGLAGHRFSDEHREKIAEALRTGADFNCRECGATFWRKQSDIRLGNNKFCSRKCYQSWQCGRSKAVPPLCTRRGVAAAARKRRAQTHCKRGHPLSGGNLFLTSQGSRGCKECRKIHKKRYRSKVDG